MAAFYLYTDQTGAVTDYTAPAYLDDSHISVTVDGVSTPFTWPSSTMIRISPAPTGDVRVQRTTPTTPLVTWSDGAVLKDDVLNIAVLQAFYIAEEALGTGAEHELAALGYKDLAEAAKVAAEAAQAAAETAQSDAETAQAAAETAQSGAETAKADAETAKADAETAETNASSSASAASASALSAASSLTDILASGRIIRSGSGVPSDALGNDGDFYIDTASATYNIYSKASGSWGSATALKGADGSPGPAGNDGDDGVGLPTGGTTAQVLTKVSGTDYDYIWSTPAGGGDMLASVYDPNTIEGDAFDMDNMVEGTTTKIMTDTERSNLSTAYGWGDHASAGYLTSETSHADVVVDGDFTSNGILKRTALGSYTIVTDNSSNWDTAYGWGDHSGLYALSAHTHSGVYEPADADILKADTTDRLTAAFESAITDDGTKSSGTYTPSSASGTNSKKIVNGGAFTFAAPSPSADDTELNLKVFIQNGGSSGAVTFSGFNSVTGDSLTTTSTDEFLLRISVLDIGGTHFATVNVEALQ